MSVGDALRDLGRVLDEYEADGTVTNLDVSGAPDPEGSGTLTAEVELEPARLPAERAAGASGHRPDGGRTLTGGLDGTGGARDVEVEVTDATLATDGTITLALTTALGGGGATAVGSPAADEGDGTANSLYDREVPPFEDPELLGEVYDDCGTFAEMADELGMDVTAETVRRYMIDHGIHEPNSYDTGATSAGGAADRRAGEAAPAVLADGRGLPDDVSVETLVGAVERSNTVFEVRQELGVERERALRLLRELDLLDLVTGRLATEAERDIGREQILKRLRASSGAR